MLKRRWSEFDIDYITRFWPTQGSGPVAIALQRTVGTVQAKAHRLGLVCDRHACAAVRGQTLADRNQSCATDYFAGEWTPNLAYIVGYVFADGHIRIECRTLSFLCHSKDEQLLLDIHSELKCQTKIARSPARQYRTRYCGPKTYFDVHSKNLVHCLIKRFGLAPRKSKKDLPLPEIPDAFFGHFLRGYFDGDGYVGCNDSGRGGRISLIATRQFAQDLHSKVCRLTGALERKITTNTSKNGTKMYYVSWGCYQDLVAIHSLMYPTGEYIYLKRKRSVFDQVVRNKPFRLMRSVRQVISPN